MHRSGTRVYADCDNHQVQGSLIDDCEDFDCEVRIFDEFENEEVVINGWLWSIDIIDENDQPIS